MAQSYATVGLETAVMSASPVKLISMLYAGAITQVNLAKHFMEVGNVASRGNAISKALEIISTGLRGSVDPTQGEIAKNLLISYEIMAHNLFLANRHSDSKYLDVVLTMLNDLSTAWNVATGQSVATSDN